MSVMSRLRRLLALVAALAPLAAVGPAAAQEAAPDLAVVADNLLPVPTITIYPGDTIAEAMIEDREFPPTVPPRNAVITGRQPLVGKIARRTLLPGKPIPVNAVAEPMLVTRGVPTQAVFQAGGITITALVFPVRSGSLGDYIQMRNIDSGKMIAGIVQADGTVLIGAGN
jgi:flagella basal body P-ring formation protein FlgA